MSLGETPLPRSHNSRRSLRDRLRDGTSAIGKQVVAVGGGVLKLGSDKDLTTTTPQQHQSSSPMTTARKSKSVDSTSSSSNTTTVTNQATLLSSMETSAESANKTVDPPPQPPPRMRDKKLLPTTTHVVTATDTLTSIAAKFETTPSELIKMNKLPGRNVFPGQELRVPVVGSGGGGMSGSDQGEEVFLDNEVEGEGLKRGVPRGHQKQEEERKFVKAKVRHVTDGNGVVSGTLLITPNAVMFDPNVSDPLVLEQGAESYGVILPTELIIQAAILSDIAGMRVEKGVAMDMISNMEGVEEERVKVYGRVVKKPPPQQIQQPTTPSKRSNSTKRSTSGSTPKRLSFPLSWNNSSSNEDLSNESGGSGGKRSSAPPTAGHDKKRDSKSFEDVGEVVGGAVNAVGNVVGGVVGGAVGAAGAGFDAVIDVGGSVVGGGAWLVRRGFERLLPTSTANTTTTTGPTTLSTTPPSSNQSPPPNYSSTTSPPPSPSHLSNTPFTPLSASSEWYLLLTTAQPLNPTPWTLRRLGLVVSYGTKNHLRPEYWFHLNREEVDVIYAFWTRWFPWTYSDEVDFELLSARSLALTTFETMQLDAQENVSHLEPNLGVGGGGGGGASGDLKESWEMLKSPYTKLSSLLNRSQTLLTSTSSSATNFGQGILDSISDFASMEVNSEEVVSMSEELRAALYGFSDEPVAIEMRGGVSEILTDEDDLKELARNLTPRAEGHPLTLLFTTSRDGFSLATLFRSNGALLYTSADTADSIPILLLIQDTRGNAFGALLSQPLRESSTSFYGTGQSFLFSLGPFRAYRWTGENLYFCRGALGEGLVVGSGDGKFGIYLDSDLNCGRSDSCDTFGNPPFVEGCDFVVKTVECWGFVGGAGGGGSQGEESGVMKQSSRDGGGGVVEGEESGVEIEEIQDGGGAE